MEHSDGKKLNAPGGDGQGGGASKPLKINFTPNGGFWVDRHELLRDPEIRQIFKVAGEVVRKQNELAGE